MGWGSRCSEKSHSQRSCTKATVQSCEQSLTRARDTGPADPSKPFPSFANTALVSQVHQPTMHATNGSFLKERTEPHWLVYIAQLCRSFGKINAQTVKKKKKCPNQVIRCMCQPLFVSLPKESVPETNLNINSKYPMDDLPIHRILHPK